MKKRSKFLLHLLIVTLVFSMIFSVGPKSLVQAAAVTSPLTMVSGNLQVGVAFTNSGLNLTKIYDSSKAQDLLSTAVDEPLFTIRLNGASINSKEGWTSVTEDLTGNVYTFVFSGNSNASGITVTVKADKSTADAIKWSIAINNTSTKKYVHTIEFPNIPVRDLGTGRQAFYPYASGTVNDLWSSGSGYSFPYPSTVSTMPYVAAYNGQTGLYLGWHANEAQIIYPNIWGDSANSVVKMGMEILAPDDTKVGNDFSTTASALMQLTPSWYDAAMIYRNWAKGNASWWPTIDNNGRTDTPDWLKKLNVWTKTENSNGETPSDTTTLAEAFQQYMGMPVGNHWYRWHEILMDGHFPEYFPAKDGFAENVVAQQNNNIYVVPYTNGRLWSSTIPSFDSEGARAAAAKDPSGALYTENDDQPNEYLATVDPSQTMWQNKVKYFTNELLNSYHVNGVYQDMVGYSAPAPCYDASHGHTLGGGDYWQKGYETMYNTNIRSNKPAGTILVTEGPADSSAKMFDAMLAYINSDTGMDGVPALHAVLADATQLMGRYYDNNESDLQWRQKNGRAFVWGEQLGWSDADIINYPSKASYLRNTAKVRAQINRSIYAGQMGRPLVLSGNSTVTGPDITTNVVENGVWMLPQDNKVVVLLTNVSNASKTVMVNMALSQYGMNSTSLNVDELGPTGKIGSFTSSTNSLTNKSVTLAAGEVKAWVITPGLPAQTGKILILAPHPDDEALMASGIMEKGITDGKTVKVGIATNGDYAASLGDMTVGQTRIRESVAAVTYLGVPQSNITVLGYGDDQLWSLYNATNADAVITSHEGTVTYGTPENLDYHYQKFGTHASYTRNNFKNDLITMINDYRPDDIYITSMYDSHPDHNTLNYFTLEAIRQLKQNDPSYAPKMHEAIIHSYDGEAVWPSHEPITSNAPMVPFSKPTTLDSTSQLDWTARESVSVPTDMMVVPRNAGNKKYNTISKYATQLGDADYMYGFIKSDEVFWLKDFSNIAPLATVTVSSQNTAAGQLGVKAIDGILDGNPRLPDKEWATVSQTTGAWINLAWSGSQKITSVKLYDRPNSNENITGATLTFSDGSSITTGALPNNGYSKTITFAEKTVTWVKLTVNTATGINIGLSEFEVYGHDGGTPTNSIITPMTATFDKKVAKQADIGVSMTLNNNSFSGIKNGSTSLIQGTDYTVIGTNVTILKKYLANQAVGTTNLTFDFSAGVDPVLAVTVVDTTSATMYYTIKDRWKGNYLNDNGSGKVNYGATASTDYYKWSLETSGGYTQLKNKATGKYMAIENQLGYVESTTVQPGWWSKDWTLVDDENGYKKITCRFQGVSINVENQTGSAEYAVVEPGMWSAEFVISAAN
ncbi:DUF6259 domain-containing protein [Paenibacillus sp. N3.4]|uniref:DUF6259 domain-containing protein n=1 Tax=Paenibacillus sp. N3.4 TaxID=2603222 RepID=UPI0011C81D8C|nr:DUF6259 domain-containing protein [Paenibacillus sp. N3.4]TXK83950.1 hypothetical protein FU659_10845 [Paenibacillus sp. N3.4]